jgi:voltage-gated potassium channel
VAPSSEIEGKAPTRGAPQRMATRLSELGPRRKRLAVLRATVTVIMTWVVLFTGYYYINPVGRDSGVSDIVRLGVGLLVVTVAVALQTRRVLRADLPGLTAGEALGVLLPIFLLLFSMLYLSLSHTSASVFSQKLDHTSALYFTVTVFSTVGFGDITPVTDTARIIVSVQMLLDLVIIGSVARLLINAAKTNLGRAGQSSSQAP